MTIFLKCFKGIPLKRTLSHVFPKVFKRKGLKGTFYYDFQSEYPSSGHFQTFQSVLKRLLLKELDHEISSALNV
jgi:hypothetical protein